MKTIFQKDYDGESLYDLERDVYESFDSKLNPEINSIPVDEYNLMKGKFVVTIQWTPDD